METSTIQHERQSYIPETSNLPTRLDSQETSNSNEKFEKLHEDFNTANIGNLINLNAIQDQIEPLRDNAGKELPCNLYIETNNIHEAAKIAQENNLGIIIVGGLSSATNNFGPKVDYPKLKGVIAIKPKGIHSEEKMLSEEGLETTEFSHYIENRTDRTTIRRNTETDEPESIIIGAGMTYGQVAKIIDTKLNTDPNREFDYFLSPDHTSLDYSEAGGNFATGAMGPSRLRIHETALRVNITNGTEIKTLTGEEIKDHEGLIGLTGGMTEIEMKLLKRPRHSFGVMVPLNTQNSDWATEYSKLLPSLEDYTRLSIDNDNKIQSRWEDGYINGSEFITRQGLEFVRDHHDNPERRSTATRLLKTLDESNSDFMVYITGFSQKSLEQYQNECYEAFNAEDENEIVNNLNQRADILSKLLAKNMSGDLGEPTPMTDLEDVRLLREAIPDSARDRGRIKPNQNPNLLIYTTSTDINSFIPEEIAAVLDTESLQQTYHEMLKPYLDYETECAAQAEENNVEVEVVGYGHGHNRSLDPHTRVIVRGNKEQQEDFDNVVGNIKKLKERLTETMLSLPTTSHIELGRGEKGQVPEMEFLTIEETNRMIMNILKAGINWNFRAPQNLLPTEDQLFNNILTKLSEDSNRRTILNLFGESISEREKHLFLIGDTDVYPHVLTKIKRRAHQDNLSILSQLS